MLFLHTLGVRRTIRRSVQLSLMQAGDTVIAAPAGVGGVRLWQEALPDLVVTDIIMPERNGIETVKETRRRAPLATILAMTGFRLDSSPELPAMARHLGADDVLTELWLAKLDALLKRVPGDDGDWLTSP